jgi:hypothetical protein
MAEGGLERNVPLRSLEVDKTQDIEIEERTKIQRINAKYSLKLQSFTPFKFS